MDISPQTIRSTGFKTVKKGYDPNEVESFRTQVAAAVETAQNQATAMEARARAAVAKLQEVSQQVASSTRDTAAPSHSGDTEVISRTLLLAQRTADSTVLEARREADGITAQAREEAARVLDSARAMATKTVEDSRLETRRAVEDERVRAENEVQSLLARRDFLLGDVDHLEQYLQAQRERLRDAAVQIQELVDRVPGGLGDMRRPLLSASAEPSTAHVPPVAPAPENEESITEAGDHHHHDIDPSATVADAALSDNAAALDNAAVADDRANIDADPSPLFTQMPGRAAGLSALAMSGDTDAQDSVWRLLDEEVASTQAAQEALAVGDVTADVTAEVPAVAPPAEQHTPFEVGGEELR